jgi:hypothetical protein
VKPIFLPLVFFGVIVSFAHPGATDPQGGHTDRKTSKYHFHHGKPAHEHPGGVCPFNPAPKAASAPPSGESAVPTGSAAATPTAPSAESSAIANSIEKHPLEWGAFGAGAIGLGWIWKQIEKSKRKRKAEAKAKLKQKLEENAARRSHEDNSASR